MKDRKSESYVDRQRAISRRMELRELLAEIPQALEKPTNIWFPNFARNLILLRDNMAALNPITQEYVGPIVEASLDALRGESRDFIENPDSERFGIINNKPTDPDKVPSWERKCRKVRGVCAEEIIMRISKQMAEPFGREPIPVEERVVSIEQIADENPSVTRLTHETVRGVQLKVLHIKHPFEDEWIRQPQPWDDTLALKGGDARIINDLYAGAPLSMLAAEIPRNDVDVVAAGNQTGARSKAYILGADADGVEMKSGRLDYQDYANSRDMTINMAWIAHDGLHTCPQAIEAAKTGIVEITGNYRPDKAIYNTDRFVWKDPETGEKIILAKQRGISREAKAAAEGKIEGYWFIDMNANTPLGIYSLWLAKRWVKYKDKPNLSSEKFGDNLQRMFNLAQKMGHVPTGVDNVMQYLESVHVDHPFFDIRKEMRDIVDEVRWKGKKIMKQIDREYGWATGVPSNFDFVRTPGDTIPRVISLGDFEPDSCVSEEILQWYSKFEEQCDVRTAHFNKLGLRPHERYFFSLGLDNPIHEEI